MKSLVELFHKYSSEPAVVFAVGALSALLLLLIITKVKKYFAFILTVVIVIILAYYLSGRKFSDIKNIGKEDVKKIGEEAKTKVKEDFSKGLPGLAK